MLLFWTLLPEKWFIARQIKSTAVYYGEIMKFTILIVDDEEEMCLSLSEILTSKGYQTIYTIDPLKVSMLLEQNHVDLILMDIKMPKLGGIDLLKIIKRNNFRIPVIMITGYPSVENAIQAMKHGARRGSVSASW